MGVCDSRGKLERLGDDNAEVNGARSALIKDQIKTLLIVL